MTAFRRTGGLYLTAAILALCTYYVLKTHVGANSSIAEHALWRVEAPYLFRWLVPCILSNALPAVWLDEPVTRIAIAAMFVGAAVYLMPAFLTRITGGNIKPRDAQRAKWVLLLIIAAHYILPRNLKFYYVYDLPSLSFYLLAFLALTSAESRTRWLGVLLTAALSTNRETIGVAVVHAVAWHGVQWQLNQQGHMPGIASRLAPCFIAAIAILLVRQATVVWLDHPVQASFSWMEGDQFRLLANLERMVTKHHHGIALLWFGAGAIIWLPRKWPSLPPEVRALLIASLPVFGFFCLVGNFVELRMFNELLPILAVALTIRPTD
jgi:hypothetical protein